MLYCVMRVMFVSSYKSERNKTNSLIGFYLSHSVINDILFEIKFWLFGRMRFECFQKVRIFFCFMWKKTYLKNSAETLNRFCHTQTLIQDELNLFQLQITKWDPLGRNNEQRLTISHEKTFKRQKNRKLVTCFNVHSVESSRSRCKQNFQKFKHANN